MTDASGQYDLTCLQAENYFAKFKIPVPYNSSYGFTSPDQGDEQYDSDVTHINGFSTTNMFYFILKTIHSNWMRGNSNTYLI